MSGWFFVRLKDSVASIFKRKYNKPSALQLRDDRAYNAYKNKIRKEVDRILDKVSTHGIKSLTKKEHKFLDENKDI